MGYFGNQTFNTKERKFVGKPLEQIAAANQIISERYEKVKQGKRALELSTEALRTQVRDQNKEHVDNALIGIKNQFNETLQNDDYENAGNVLASSIDELARNQELKYSQEDYKRMQSYQEELKKRLKAGEGKGGLDQATINYALAKSNAINNKKIAVDDKGNVTGMFQGINPIDDRDWTKEVVKLADEYRKGMGTNSSSRASGSGYKDSTGSGFARYMVETGSTGASADQIKNMAYKYLQATPEYAQWVQQQADMRVFNELQKDDSGNYVYDKEGNLSYAPMISEDGNISDNNPTNANKIFTNMYNNYANIVDNNKKLSKEQKRVLKQNWVSDYQDSTNEQRVAEYKNLVANDINSRIINAAGAWENKAYQSKFSDVDWEAGNKGGEGTIPPNAMITSNSTGAFVAKPESIAESYDKKTSIESNIQNLKQQIAKSPTSPYVKMWEENLSKQVVQLDVLNRRMNKQVEYAKNPESDRKIQIYFEDIIANSKNGGNLNEEDANGEVGNIIRKYKSKVRDIQSNLFNRKVDMRAMKQLYEDFSKDMYGVAIAKFPKKGTIIDAYSGSLSNPLMVGIANAAINAFEKSNKEDLIENVNVLTVPSELTEDKKNMINKQNDMLASELMSTSTYIYGTNKSFQDEIANSNTEEGQYGYYDEEGKWKQSRVDPAKCKVELANMTTNGDIPSVVYLKNSEGKTIGKKEESKDESRFGRTYVKLENNEEAKKLLYNRGKVLVSSTNKDHVNYGLEGMANANFNAVVAARPDYLDKGEPLVVTGKVIDGSPYELQIVGVGKNIGDDNKPHNSFKVAAKHDDGRWHPIQESKGVDKTYQSTQELIKDLQVQMLNLNTK